jgi:hypothetical protein
MDGKFARGRHLTRSGLAIAICLVLVACAIAHVVLASYGGLPPRRLVRALIGLMPYVGLLVVLIALVASMLAIFGGPASPPRAERTRGWYWTRIELAIGIGVVLLAAASYLLEPAYMGGFGPHWLETPLTSAAYVGMLVGLVWMVRIYRGPRDEPPPWRYRDRTR